MSKGHKDSKISKPIIRKTISFFIVYMFFMLFFVPKPNWSNLLDWQNILLNVYLNILFAFVNYYLTDILKVKSVKFKIVMVVVLTCFYDNVVEFDLVYQFIEKNVVLACVLFSLLTVIFVDIISYNFIEKLINKTKDKKKQEERHMLHKVVDALCMLLMYACLAIYVYFGIVRDVIPFFTKNQINA